MTLTCCSPQVHGQWPHFSYKVQKSYWLFSLLSFLLVVGTEGRLPSSLHARLETRNQHFFQCRNMSELSILLLINIFVIFYYWQFYFNFSLNIYIHRFDDTYMCICFLYVYMCMYMHTLTYICVCIYTYK